MNAGFKQAKLASTKSDFHAQHIGAAVFYKGSLLSLGYNSEKTRTSQKQYNKYRDFNENIYPARIHAEVMALNKIKYLDINFSKVKLYIWRGKTKPQLAKPCPACEQYIRSLGIKNVFYSGDRSLVSEKYM